MRRGQATVELALILPFVAGLLALALQGGAIISDQVALEHYAYLGAQYATSQNLNATPSQIASYITSQICGASPTRYCSEPAGMPQPTLVSVTASTVSAAAQPRPGLNLGLWTDALAAGPSPSGSPCTAENWQLKLTIDNLTVYDGGVGGPSAATITISFDKVTGSGAVPAVTLSGGFWPPGTVGASGGTPTFANPVISPSGSTYPNSTTVYLNAINAIPGVYSIPISGQDQCKNGPNGGTTSIKNFKVLPATVQATVSPPTTPTINGVNPPQVCAGLATTINIIGTNFTSGDSVTFGASTPATSVTYISATNLTVGTPPLATGVYNITVKDPSGSQGTLINAITATASCLVPPSPPPPPPCGVAAALGSGSVEAVITLTWNEPLAVPWFGGAYITLTAQQVVLCQSPPRPTPSP